MSKTNPGRFFEDYTVGDVIKHAVPRTISGGERAVYHALYPQRHAMFSSDEFARDCGLHESPMDDLMLFHLVFGKTVPDISLNAVANLGYAECRFLKPVFLGDTIRAESEVIGVKENSNGKTGVVWVRTTGTNQMGEEVLTFVRWVMIRKRDPKAPAPTTVIPELSASVPVSDFVLHEDLRFDLYNFEQAGEPHRLADYEIGEKIDHVDRMTVEEVDHMLATRLWQNTAKVHFDVTARDGQPRLIYGGHVMSLARTLSFNGLANAQMMLAINGGSHVAPCTAGMTVGAWSEVLEKADLPLDGAGAMRVRLVAYNEQAAPFDLRNEDGTYMPGVLLDMDYWVLMPE